MSVGDLSGAHVGRSVKPGGVRAGEAEVDFPLRPDPRFTGTSQLLSQAYAFAREAHAGQRQESDGAPYIDHPVAVARLLYLAGCGEEVVAAGLLHDTVEDTDTRLEDLERRFGPAVSELVAAMTEPAEVHPFRARKDALRRQIANAGYEAEAIFAADKVVSAHTLRKAIAAQGEAQVRDRLANPLDEKVEHYRKTLGLLNEVAESLPLVPLLREELDKLAGEHAWQARLATIDRLVESFNRRSMPAVLELCDPDIEWSPELTADGVGRPYRGHEGVRRYFADLAAAWDEARAVVYRLTPHGDKLLSLCGVWAQAHEDGREVSQQMAVVFSFREGRIAAARTYTDLAAARRAADG